VRTQHAGVGGEGRGKKGKPEETDEPYSSISMATVLSSPPSAEAAALASALSFYLRRRFGADGLEMASDALSLRSVSDLSHRLQSLSSAGMGGRVVLGETDLRALREALCFYVAERDTDSYQPPEERERLQELRELSEPLGDLVAAVPAAQPSRTPLALR
jgi:hypothetical protein